jgi:hypothetical protein
VGALDYATKRLAAMLNCLLAAHFGAPEAANVVEYAHDIDLDNFRASLKALNQDARDLINEACEIAENERFFHWEIEFPEVFFEEQNAGVKEKQNPGFDVVIGNPPYVRQEQLGSDKAYYEIAYDVYQGVADICVCFYERGHDLLEAGGLPGMITLNKFMRANYGEPLRKFLAEICGMKQRIDFGDLPVFGEVTAYPVICISGHQHARDGVKYLEGE